MCLDTKHDIRLKIPGPFGIAGDSFSDRCLSVGPGHQPRIALHHLER